jgi:hypothetical protein
MSLPVVLRLEASRDAEEARDLLESARLYDFEILAHFHSRP